MSDYIRQNTIDIQFKSEESWAILSPIEQSIKAKIEAVGTPLRDWDIKINRGVLTGLNEAFIIDKNTRDKLIRDDPKSAEIIRPILRGKDIKRNEYDFKNQFLIVSHNGYKDSNGNTLDPINIDEYPAVKNWLDSEDWNTKPDKGSASDRLVKRGDKGRTAYNLRDCAYMDDFNKQKIVWADIAKEPTFVQINESIFFNNTCYMIVGAPAGLVSILNSQLIEWYFPKIATDIGDGGARYFKQFVELIQVPFDIEDRNYTDDNVFDIYGLTDDEINFISSSVKSKG